MEGLNHQSLVRLVEARSWATNSTQAEEPAGPGSDSQHAVVLVVQGQPWQESAARSRILKRLRSESTQLIQDLAPPGQEFAAD
jgi:hypothetical protein